MTSEFWADEDCWSLMSEQCYKGFTPYERNQFMNMVGGPLPAGISAGDREVCEIIQAALNYNAQRGEVGIWLNPDENSPAWVDLATSSRRMAVRSSSHVQNSEYDRIVAFHEGYHVATGNNDDVIRLDGMTEANYYGRVCARGYP